MNVYEFAKKMELDGEKYYRELAEMTKEDGLKSIFLRLAEDEKKHHEILCNIEENFEYCNDEPELDCERTLFAKKLDKVENFDFDKSHIDAYKHAAKLEKESIEFYKEKRKEADRECEKAVFNRLLKEEKRHLEELEIVIRHLRKPEEWVEDPEFTHGEEY